MIELLVVVAIIALLISILLPSLAAARESARRAVCGASLKGLGTSGGVYQTENADWIPGPNTSGVSVRTKMLFTNAEPFQDPDLPVQNFDWITPLVSNSESMPASRAERWKLIWERYSCPSIQGIRSTLYRPNALPDAAAFKAIEWNACSFLMPTPFAVWGDRVRNVLARDERTGSVPITPMHAPAPSQVRHDTYVSRINRVGQTSGKIFAADGTRYLPGGDAPLDHDARPNPSTYGAFTSAGAWWGGSTAYGVAVGSQTYGGASVAYTGSRNIEGLNLRLSYRHTTRRGGGSAQSNPGLMDALFFDGHVESLNDRASREITLWYPSGSVVHSNFDGMTAVPNGFVVP